MQFLNEILKKINEKNVIWFALTICVSVVAILISPDFFFLSTITLQNGGIGSPYASILMLILYLSVGVLLVKPVPGWLQRRGSRRKFYKLRKQIEKLPEKELWILKEFAYLQDQLIRVKAENVHIARLLDSKGIIKASPEGPYGSGEQYFYMDKELLNYLTSKYQDEINEVRPLIIGKKNNAYSWMGR